MPEPTVPKHSSQGSVHIDETTVNSSNPSNIDETVNIDEASERPRDLWLSILEQQVECHANKLDSFEEAVTAILRAQETGAERMKTIEGRTHEQMKTIKAIQQEMQSLKSEHETHVEQFRLRIVDTWKHATEMHTLLANRLDKVQNSLQNCRIASAARPDWNRH